MLVEAHSGAWGLAAAKVWLKMDKAILLVSGESTAVAGSCLFREYTLGRRPFNVNSLVSILENTSRGEPLSSVW